MIPVFTMVLPVMLYSTDSVQRMYQNPDCTGMTADMHIGTLRGKAADDLPRRKLVAISVSGGKNHDSW